MRTANFSSSQIYKLMASGKAKGSIGAPFYTYVKEKIYEKRLGRPIQKEQGGKAPSWGTFVESRVFELLPLDYTYQSEKRYTHPELAWSGAPDMLTTDKVVDIKCPYSILEYCKKADIMILSDVEALKSEYPENYYQLVSNSILTDKKVGFDFMLGYSFAFLTSVNAYMPDPAMVGLLTVNDKTSFPFLNASTCILLNTGIPL